MLQRAVGLSRIHDMVNISTFIPMWSAHEDDEEIGPDGGATGYL